MAAGSYQLIWVAGSTAGGSAVNLSQLAQGGAATGQAIVWNGSAWAPGTIAGSGGGTLNSLSGDVTTGTVDGSGNAVTTVQNVGSYTAAQVVAGVAAVNTATNINQGGALVKRDGSGNFAAGTISAALSGNATTATTAYNYGGSITLSQLTQSSAGLNQVIAWNGMAWAPATVSGGGGGSGITALTGDVTASGTGSVAATVAQVGGKTASAVASTVTTVAAATDAATPSTLMARDSSGNVSVGTITGTLSGNATNITGNLALTQLAQGGATSGQALLWNGSAWAAGTVSGGGGTGITQLNGDVTTPAASSGNTTATVAQVGGKTASAVASAVNTVAAATSSGTASTLVMRDASSQFGGVYTGTLGLSQLTQSSATANQAIIWNGTAWAPSSLSFISALTGDVSASGPGNSTATVNSVGGSSASAINSAVTAVAAATNSSTASTIVKRDASQNFSAGTITASLSGNATTATTAASATSYTGTVTLSQLAQTSATSGQAVVWNGSAWAPGTVSGGGSGITQLTGDVTTASGSSGATAATVASVGGQTASFVGYWANQASLRDSANTVSVIAARDSTGAIYQTNPTIVMTGSSITATAATSNVTYMIASGTNTVTLLPNPSNVSYRYTFMGNGGSITVAPPATGTTPTFYYWGGSTTNSFNVVNLQTANYIECVGIPGTSNYFLRNIQGNWQSAGNALGVYSALSYPSTSGYVLTANGNTGMAAFAAPTGGNVNHSFFQYNNFASLAASTVYTFNSVPFPYGIWVAPVSGTLTRICGVISARNPGPGGNVALGVYKNPTLPSGGSGATLTTGTLLGSTGTTAGPGSAAQTFPNAAVSTSNTFAAGDKLVPVFITGTGVSSSGSYDVQIQMFVQTALQ